jgi:hypothetical protein
VPAGGLDHLQGQGVVGDSLNPVVYAIRRADGIEWANPGEEMLTISSRAC